MVPIFCQMHDIFILTKIPGLATLPPSEGGDIAGEGRLKAGERNLDSYWSWSEGNLKI